MPSLQLSVVDGIAAAAAPPPLVQETPPSTPPPPEPPRSNGIAFSLTPPPPQHPHSARSSPDQHLTESVDEKRAMSLGRVDPLVSPGKPVRSNSGAPSKIINWFRKKKADKTLSSPQGQ